MSPGTPTADTPEFNHSILINASPARVMAAFFDAHALATWWQVARSVTAARPLGVYAVEWPATPDADEILGRLGGTFYGIVMEYDAGHEFFVADAFWLPPDGEPIGPMALTVTCTIEERACRLHVRQSGYEESPRWRRYYNVIGGGWTSSLAALKTYVETL